ncbi:unnamed protein product [Diamesa tonsa]
MGICLDTESNTAQATEEQEEMATTDWKGGGRIRSQPPITRTPKSGNAQIQNIGKVKFVAPKVPVIFVLGGPGSGKVTHCDTLMQEKRGVTHINMMDLLQQYAIGNDMTDFSQLPSKTVTEVLMLEMKMSPAAKTYLISGYPRSMRDVVEYSEKIQVINGVILISWRQAVLQRQIDYGAKLGHVVLSLAKMELDNFFKSVMPVADYFDQSDMLIAVNGERAPSEVYKDFRSSVLDILSAQENQEALLNGVGGIGHGIDDIPGSIVSVETAPSQNKTNQIVPVTTPDLFDPPSKRTQTQHNNSMTSRMTNVVQVETIPDRPVQNGYAHFNKNNNLHQIPPVIWVIGGPGSNKATLCLKAVGMNPGWGHFSVGRSLRALADSAPKPHTENFKVKEAITAGELVSKDTLEKLIETNLIQLMDRRGIIIDGYPRHMDQVQEFEDKYKQKPQVILLDCSKLQLGRGRLDDTVSSFRRRLELFREFTLPMLKIMDGSTRLTIVDGDTDSSSVQREFERIVRQQIEDLGGNNIRMNGNIPVKTFGSVYERNDKIQSQTNNDATVYDLEDDMPSAIIPTISSHVSMSNGHLGRNPTQIQNNNIKRTGQNGHIPNNNNFRTMLEDAESDSHI